MSQSGDVGQPSGGGGGVSSLVRIEIQGKPYQVTRGTHMVVELKTLAGIPLCDELSIMKLTEPVPLPDDGAVSIEGGETFIGVPRSCSSS